jgi:hypothetical protein
MFSFSPAKEAEAPAPERFAEASLRNQAKQKVQRTLEEKKDRARARRELGEDRERFADLEEYAWQQHNHASSSLDNTLRVLRGRALKQKQQDKVEVRRASRSARRKQMSTRVGDRGKAVEADEERDPTKQCGVTFNGENWDVMVPTTLACWLSDRNEPRTEDVSYAGAYGTEELAALAFDHEIDKLCGIATLQSSKKKVLATFTIKSLHRMDR